MLNETTSSERSISKAVCEFHRASGDGQQSVRGPTSQPVSWAGATTLLALCWLNWVLDHRRRQCRCMCWLNWMLDHMYRFRQCRCMIVISHADSWWYSDAFLAATRFLSRLTLQWFWFCCRFVLYHFVAGLLHVYDGSSDHRFLRGHMWWMQHLRFAIERAWREHQMFFGIGCAGNEANVFLRNRYLLIITTCSYAYFTIRFQ